MGRVSKDHRESRGAGLRQSVSCPVADLEFTA